MCCIFDYDYAFMSSSSEYECMNIDDGNYICYSTFMIYMCAGVIRDWMCVYIYGLNVNTYACM